jgi:hypothetical protein
MRLFAYLPIALRPESENALLVGYGVGVTADAFKRNARLKNLDIVDISKEVFDLADFYTGPGYSNRLRDPRVTTFVQDGRFFLQACPHATTSLPGNRPLENSGNDQPLHPAILFADERPVKGWRRRQLWLPFTN